MNRQVISGIMLTLLFFSMFIHAQTKVSAADYPAIYVEPASIIEPTLTPGENFTISIMTNYTGADVTGWQLALSFNADIIHGVNVTNGNLITEDKHPNAVFIPGIFNNTEGKLSLTAAFFFFAYPPPPVTPGPGTLANLTFTVVGYGASEIIIESDTEMFGWDFIEERAYRIIDAEAEPDHIGHGYFSNGNVCIYIRSDGSIDPPTAPVEKNGDLYKLTGDYVSDTDGIVIERSNMMLDGGGYILQGTGFDPFRGIDLSGSSNVTIKNTNIKSFYHGVYLSSSSSCTVSENNITATKYCAIRFFASSSNVIMNNDIMANYYYSIRLDGSSNNSLAGNHITASGWYAIYLYGSSNNKLRNNSVSNNEYNFGVYGPELSNYIQDIDDSNTANGKPVCYWVNRRAITVPLDAGWIVLINCTRITIQKL
ncbi:MAG: right-handed parallel beta-helix repeat-containing protein, partial [Candidatus Bathyarchaeota archaeon]